MKTKAITRVITAFFTLAIIASCFTVLATPVSAETKRDYTIMKIDREYKSFIAYHNVEYRLDLDYFKEQFPDNLDSYDYYTISLCFEAKKAPDESSCEYYYSKGDSLRTTCKGGEVFDLGVFKGAEPDLKTEDLSVIFKEVKGDYTVGAYYTFTFELTCFQGRRSFKHLYPVEIRLYPVSRENFTITISDFAAPVHGKALDYDAYCDYGRVISIRYLDKDKKTERKAATYGEEGWIEFTVVQSYGYDCCYWGNTGTLLRSPGGAVSTGGAQREEVKGDKTICKFYHYYKTYLNETYSITKAGINFENPVEGAKPGKVKSVSGNTKRVGRFTRTVFNVGSPIWLTKDTTFKAGKAYTAMVKLTPAGQYYFPKGLFMADKPTTVSSNGAEKVQLSYLTAGANEYVKESGWYLIAQFPKIASKYYDIQLSYDRAELSAPQSSTAYLTALSSYDLSKATDVNVKWYCSADINKDATGTVCSASDGDLKLQLDTSAIGTSYYRCEVSCKVNGLPSRVSYPASKWVKVNVTEKSAATLMLSAVGKQNVDLTKKGQKISFEVSAKNTKGNVSYSWYGCDAAGKNTDNVVLATGKKLTMNDLDGEYGDTHYFKCIAKDSKGSDSLIFVANIRYEKTIADTANISSASSTTATDSNIVLPGITDSPENVEGDSTSADATQQEGADSSVLTANGENPKSDNGMLFIILLIILAVLLIAGGTTGIIIFVKKKNKQ